VDPTTGQEFSVGGTKRILGNVELFMPVPLIKDTKQFRLSAFVDAGAVYGASQSIDSEALRYSAGVGVTWVSPFGPLKLILAQPLNDKEGE